MDFIRPQTARAITAKTMKPRTPGVTLFSSTSLARGTRCVSARLALMSGIVADARKEVVLGEGCVHEGLRELVLLGRPDLPLDLHGDLEPAAVGVDLRGVRDQRLVTDLEEVRAGNVRGQRALGALELAPALQPVPVRRLHPAVQERVVQRLGARAVEALV